MDQAFLFVCTIYAWLTYVSFLYISLVNFSKPGRCTSFRLILKAVYQNRQFIMVIGPSVVAVYIYGTINIFIFLNYKNFHIIINSSDIVCTQLWVLYTKMCIYLVIMLDHKQLIMITLLRGTVRLCVRKLVVI